MRSEQCREPTRRVRIGEVLTGDPLLKGDERVGVVGQLE
jgi:hypothetical protein